MFSTFIPRYLFFDSNTLNATGGFALRELIKKDYWDNTTNNYKDAGSVIYTNGIITNDNLFIKFDGFVGDQTLRVEYDIHTNSQNLTVTKEPSSIRVALKSGLNIFVLSPEIPYVYFNNSLSISAFNSKGFYNLTTINAEYEIGLYVVTDIGRFIPASGKWARLTYLGQDIVNMPSCPAVSIRAIFNSIFGVDRYILPTLGIGQLVFVNSDMLNFVPNPKLTIKVSEFIKDVCNATASAMVFDNGKYQFKAVDDLRPINFLQLPYVKDFKISFSKAMNYTEFEFGSKMPSYKFMISDRNFFTQKITWQPENLFGQKYSLSLSKLRVDCVGIYDCIRSFVDVETSNSNGDYWAVVIDPETMDTVKPLTISGVDQQTGWFNLDLSPRRQMQRNTSLLNSFLNYRPRTIKVSAAENYIATMA